MQSTINWIHNVFKDREDIERVLGKKQAKIAARIC